MGSEMCIRDRFTRFCDQEFSDSAYDKDAGLSKEDSHAISIMEQAVKLKLGHYEVALPWRNTPPNLPNRRLAEHRLKLLRRRLPKDQGLHSKYSAFTDDLLKDGHARMVLGDRRDRPVSAVWYLPHHPVLNANKPGKVRVVSTAQQGTREHH